MEGEGHCHCPLYVCANWHNKSLYRWSLEKITSLITTKQNKQHANITKPIKKEQLIQETVTKIMVQSPLWYQYIGNSIRVSAWQCLLQTERVLRTPDTYKTKNNHQKMNLLKTWLRERLYDSVLISVQQHKLHQFTIHPQTIMLQYIKWTK